MAKQIKTLSIQGYGGCILILGIYNTIAAMMGQVVGYSDLIDGSMAKKRWVWRNRWLYDRKTYWNHDAQKQTHRNQNKTYGNRNVTWKTYGNRSAKRAQICAKCAQIRANCAQIQNQVRICFCVGVSLWKFGSFGWFLRISSIRSLGETSKFTDNNRFVWIWNLKAYRTLFCVRSFWHRFRIDRLLW